MRSIQSLRDKKKELRLTNQEIADLSGIPLGTVQKFFSGATRSPGIRTISAIDSVLFPQELKEDAYKNETLLADRVSERRSAYGIEEVSVPEGGYTYADYVALPDDRRVELIDGRFYDLAAPNSRHQIIIGQLYLQVQACMQNHPECMVLLSPLDVMLDNDDRTVVQPDLLVVCDRSKMRKGRVFGAPDLVIEVISPESRRMDYGKKAAKYIDAGVREYWIIDFENRHVMVYQIDQNLQIRLLNTEEDIPVGISDGKCIIHMGIVQKFLDDLGDI